MPQANRDNAPKIAPMMLLRPAAAADQVELLIYGDIGESWWGESVTALSIVQQLNALDASVAQINVRVNSYGGSVSDGLAIYNALRRAGARKVVTVDGVAMSSASLIAMAGDEVLMPEASMLMVHAPWGVAQGNAEDMRTMAAVLDTYAQSMAGAYARKTGKPAADMLALLTDGKDHYYTGAQAVDEGFADALVDTAATADTSNSTAARAEALFARLSRYVDDSTNRPAAHQAIAAALRAPCPVAVIAAITPAASADSEENPMNRNIRLKLHAPEGAAGGGGGPAAPAPSGQPSASDIQSAAKADAIKAIEERNSAILNALKTHVDAGVAGIVALQQEALANPSMTLEQVQARALTILGAAAVPANGGGGRVGAGEDQADKHRAAALQVILARANARDESGRAVATDGANPLRGYSLSEIAEHRVKAAGLNTSHMTKREIVAAAMSSRVMAAAGHTTSDFPILLENALNKLLLAAYRGAPTTWQRIARIGDLNDFRAHGRYRIGTFSDLSEVNEAGQYQQGTVSDAEKESITAKRKGRILLISREMVVNDDLQAIVDIANGLGSVAGRSIDKDLYALFALNSGAGPTMSDGLALFHATHNNIAGTTGAPTVTTIAAGRVGMAKQKDPSGNDYLDIRPAIWLGPLDLGGSARVVNGSQYDPDTANKLQRPNICYGLFRDVVDTPRLSALSTTAWYMLADPAIEPVFEVGFVGGDQNPMLEQAIDFDSDGLKWKCVHEYGVAAIGWRGAWKNAG